MVNEFKLTIVHVAHPNPMQICECAWSYHWPKNCGKSGLGCGLPGCCGPWAFGPVGRCGPAFSKTPKNYYIYNNSQKNGRFLRFCALLGASR